MKIAQDRLRSVGTAVLIVVSSLLLFYILYRLRSFDDSRFTSWNDVFEVVQPMRMGVRLLISLAGALLLSLIPLIERRPAVSLFVISFAVSAVFWQEPEMIVDASRYFTQAKHLEVYGFGYFFREWGNGIHAWTDLPAIPFIYGSLFVILGESRLVIQCINSLFFSSAIVLTYLIGKELWNREAGFHAALFLLGIPYLFTQVPLMLVDLPSMFFLMLAIYTFLLAIRHSGLMVAISSLIIFVSFFTKYSTWLMLTIIPVIYAVELHRNRKRELDRYALRGLIVFFVSFFLISIVIAFKHDEIVKQIHLLISYQKPGLQRWGESLVSTYFFQMHPLIPLLAALSLVVAIRNRDITYVIVAWLVFVVLVLQIRRIRYVVMVFPLLSLMASYGLELIRNRSIASFIAYSTAAFSITLALSGFLPFLQQTSAANLRDAGDYLNKIDIETVEVFTPLPVDYLMNPAVSLPLLDLYTEKKIIYNYAETEYPVPEDIGTSALRFTWAYMNPLYYQEKAAGDQKRAVLVISDSMEKKLPASLLLKIARLPKKMTFGVSDNVFRHQTLVTVYH